MSKNKLIFKNSAFLAVRTVFISFISLFTVREVLNLLGAQTYGLFTLIFGVATLFTFVNAAMVTSTQRYLAYQIGKRDFFALKTVFRTGLILHLLIAISLSLILFLLKDIILFSFLNIDTVLLDKSIYVYYAAILTIFIAIIQTPFNSLILAHEKMSFYAYISLLDALLKLIIVYVLYTVSIDRLIAYSVLLVISSFLVFLIYLSFCIRNYSKIIFKSRFSVDIFKELFFYSSWSLFGSFAYVSKMQGVNMILNLYFGTIINSAYAISNSINSVLANLINSITTAINPQIYKSYAENNYQRNHELILIGSKYSFYLALVVVFPLLIVAPSLVSLWLTNVPPHTIFFIRLVMIVLLIDCLSGTLMTGIQATGKIKKYQISVGFFVFLNLPLSYLILYFFNIPELVFFVAIILALACLELRLRFLEVLINFNKLNYYLKVIKPATLCISFLVGISFVLHYQLPIEKGPLNIIMEMLFALFFVFISVVFIGLNRSERLFLLKLISERIK